MSSLTIPKGADGFYHPSSEEDLIALVAMANEQGKLLRVRGSAHSVACAVYTDCTVNQVNVETPPPGDNINVILDGYRSFRVVDHEKMIVEVDAGLNLGLDPFDPTGTSTLENSLLYQLWNDYGWTLPDLGGITHQTVSGFLSTGSSGGSLIYSIDEAILGFRMIDGTGEVYEVSRNDADPDSFNAVGVSMGLLGIVSKVTLQCVPTFNISGQEATSTCETASIDMFGDGSDGRPTLEQFLRDAEYARLTWWPQRGGERVQVWQCQRMKPQLGFRPARYEEFTNYPELAEIGICIFYTIIGNLDDLSRAKTILEETFEKLRDDEKKKLPQVADMFRSSRGLGDVGQHMGTAIDKIAEGGVGLAIDWLKLIGGAIKMLLPDIFPYVLDIFVPLDSTKKGMQKDEPQTFRDYGWSGLPMDNQASDLLVPTEFTEIWLPLGMTQKAMALLNDYFLEPTSKQEAYKRTGTYGWELYSATPTSIWMSPSYSSGSDEWKEGVFRIDPYWYANNAGDPAEVFYPQLWDLLRSNGIPFRLHWGKFQPIVEEGDPEGWLAFFRSQYPRWDDFLATREKRDPNNIFLNDYWRERFGLWDAPRPTPTGASAAVTTDDVLN